jgi:uncharacterized protein (DUF779 family)
MGDRCYMQITLRKQDLEAHKEEFEELFTESFEPSPDGSVGIYDAEANYSYGVSDRYFGQLPRGVPFYGGHGRGDNYRPSQFATDGVTIRCAETSSDDGDEFAIEFNQETGEPNPGEVQRVKEFIEFRNKVKALVHGKEVPNG